jgi:hypothetical protein
MSGTLRSRTGIGAGALAALCLAAVAATAQERPATSRQDRGDTVKINISGDVVMDFVYRSPELTFLTDAINPASAQESDGETTAEGEVMVRFDVELTDKISAVVEIGKKRTADGGGIDEFGGASSEDVVLRTAYLKIQELFTAGLSAQLGQVTWTFDVRGKGSSFAFDPRYSQTITRNSATTEDTFAIWATKGNDANQLEPVGAWLSWNKDALTIDLVMLPVISEGGNPSGDESMYAVDAWYNLESSVGKGSRIGVIAAIHGLDGTGVGTQSPTQMITVGAGVNLVFPSGFELYGEIYKQAGKIGEDAGGDNITAKGFAGQAGFDIHFQGENNIWIGFNLTYVSGDDDDDASDRDANAFMSYENVNDLLILENQYFGIDLDTNYTAFKIKGGFSYGKWDIMAIVGIVRASEEISDGAGDHEDVIGNELDVNVRYNLNKQVALTGNIGFLAGSDLLEGVMGSSGDAEDRATVGSFGFDVRW